MKRIARLAISLLVAVSLVLFIANAAWWVRSYFVADFVMHLSTDKPAGASTTKPAMTYRSRKMLAFAPMRGRVQIGYMTNSHSGITLLPDGWMRKSVPTRMVMASQASWKTLGFGYYHETVPADVVVTINGAPVQESAPLAESWDVWVPCWFIAVLTAVIPALWLRSQSQRRKPVENRGA